MTTPNQAPQTPAAPQPPEITRGWLRQRSILRGLRFEAKRIMMLKAIEKLNSADPSDYHDLEGALFGVTKSTSEETLTSHERVLDNWRIVVTVSLIVVLFGVIALVVLVKSATGTGTPYVSLISGLAGIALGWMFANAGTPSTKKRLPKTKGSSGTPPPDGAGTS